MPLALPLTLMLCPDPKKCDGPFFMNGGLLLVLLMLLFALILLLLIPAPVSMVRPPPRLELGTRGLNELRSIGVDGLEEAEGARKRVAMGRPPTLLRAVDSGERGEGGTKGATMPAAMALL